MKLPFGYIITTCSVWRRGVACFARRRTPKPEIAMASSAKAMDPTGRANRVARWCLMPMIAAMHVLFVAGAGAALQAGETAWVNSQFDGFIQGQFDDGGSNLYVNAHGVIEMIHRWDVNNDGHVDLVLANSHDHIERGPTYVYALAQHGQKGWRRQQLSADSGWMSRIVDLDKDGFADLIVANGENGVTSKLPSYVYWGGTKGLGAQRTELPTAGAYDVAVTDINRDGHLDLIFPSAWIDHHNPGKPMLTRVYLGSSGRQFQDATRRYGVEGIAATAAAAADLNEDGFVDLVVANYRVEFDYDTESYIYWGTKDGLNTKSPLRLPTRAPLHLVVGDLNRDGKKEIIFSGGNRVQIFWNRAGKFDPAHHLIIEAPGHSSMFSRGAVRCDVADVDGDESNDLIMATNEGVEVRSGNDLQKVQTTLPLTHVHWVTAFDLNGDGRKDLVVSRYDDGRKFDCKSPVYWNGPAGFSTDRVTWFPTAGAVGNTAGDLDGDGRPEVVFSNTMSGHVKEIHNYIYLGNEAAEYGIERRLELPGGSDQCAIADLDLDGYPEVVFAGATYTEGASIARLRIHQGGPHGPVPNRFVDLPTNDTLQDVDVADFNRDGYLDLLFTCQVYDAKPETLAKSAGIYYGSKDGFKSSRFKPIEMMGSSGSIADVNKDGFLDLLFADKRSQVLIYLGSVDGYSKQRTWKIPCPALVTVGTVNTADINGDGWLDLIVGIMGHYTGLKDTLYVYYGSSLGYDLDNSQTLPGGYSPILTAVADYNRDGNLDVLVTAYSSSTTRVIPAQLFWGNGKTLDLDRPLNLPAESSAAAMQVDLNRDGWVDLFLACHRNDIGHQVDSLIYWNGPGGFAPDMVTRLPGLGPHGIVTRDHGNAYTREPRESYTSPAFDIKDRAPSRISWNAEVPPPSKLRFQFRWAATKERLGQAKWLGPGGENTYFEKSGQRVPRASSDARWLQYRAVFVSPYGCRSPRLKEVRMHLSARR